jgi:hypothetical protein
LKCLDAASRKRSRILRARDTAGKNYKFIPAEPCHGILDPDASPNAVSRLPKRVVPDIMTVDVINALEAIEINKQNGKPSAGVLVETNGALKTLTEQPSIGQTGQWIMKGSVLCRGLAEFSCRDV